LNAAFFQRIARRPIQFPWPQMAGRQDDVEVVETKIGKRSKRRFDEPVPHERKGVSAISQGHRFPPASIADVNRPRPSQ
jgi:hypothetical protein